METDVLLDVPLHELNLLTPETKIFFTISGLFLMTSLCVALDSTKQPRLRVHILACVCVYHFSVI